jgi:hypothetical protein
VQDLSSSDLIFGADGETDSEVSPSCAHGGRKETPKSCDPGGSVIDDLCLLPPRRERVDSMTIRVTNFSILPMNHKLDTFTTCLVATAINCRALYVVLLKRSCFVL